ncbi:hypothetical protein N9115_00325 [bacterium]|nr:hypothetical protein [bacterium]MDB4577093.1 hypothetical protein [bacterium]
MITRLIFLLASITAINLAFADNNTALQSLQQSWQKARENALKPIDQKYLSALRNLKDRLMKSGNLEGATAVEAEIKRMQGNPNPGVSASKAPSNDQELVDFIAGNRWKFDNNRIVTFRENGKINKSWGKLSPPWRVKGMKIYFENKIIKLDDSLDKMIVVSGSGDFGKYGDLQK